MKQTAHKEVPCTKPSGGRAGGAAFLLAQLGSHAASQFAARLAQLELIPAHAGIFRILAATPAITQQALATALGTLPSRLVAIVDELESKGLLERRPHESDRRVNTSKPCWPRCRKTSRSRWLVSCSGSPIGKD